MNQVMNWAYHGMVGNDAPEVQVGLNRGGLLLAMQGVLNGVLLVLPLDWELRGGLMASLNPTLGFLSYVGFAFLDRWLKAKGLKPS